MATARAVPNFLVAILSALACLVPAQAPCQTAVERDAGDRHYAGEVVLPVHKSQVVRVAAPFAKVAVGNPDIADVMVLTSRSFYVLGKAPGVTNLALYDRDRQLMAVLDLVVGFDTRRLRERLAEVLPSETIEVRAADDSVVLSGTVSSAERLRRAEQLAERYAPKRVANLLAVKGSQQVMLKVKVAEIARSTARQLGIKPTLNFGGGSFIFSTLDPVGATAFVSAIANIKAKGVTGDVLIDALEERGLVKILAEPNLVALSGDTASFLAGGEFPIPVAQTTGSGGGTAITVEFKRFGVSLAFTPTVIDGDVVNLVVSPEVSQIDRTNAVTVSGFAIPGLSTRRATTTIELKDGQSFAIAGLLQSNFTDDVRQLPWLGDIPILGALMRSSSFQRNETELVIIVTPRLVKPAPAGSLAAPTDTFLPPSDADLFFWGRNEAVAERLPPPAGNGLAGPHGYIVK
jgi:pilus assembly protein CpaC